MRAGIPLLFPTRHLSFKLDLNGKAEPGDYLLVAHAARADGTPLETESCHGHAWFLAWGSLQSNCPHWSQNRLR